MRHRRRDAVSDLPSVRQWANQAFSRASGAPLREGNHVTLLKDAAENYPAWLNAIRVAKRTIHFEMYIVHEDDQAQLFADALLRKASEGVRVRLLYDWMGGFGKTSRRYWNRLRSGGVDVRCYNPPRFDHPLGWLSRDHRKTITIDGAVAFVTGLCVGRMVAGAVRVGNTVAAAITNTRVLESVEANIALLAGAILVALAVVSFEYPRALAYPVGVLAAWLAAAILARGIDLYRAHRSTNDPPTQRK